MLGYSFYYICQYLTYIFSSLNSHKENITIWEGFYHIPYSLKLLEKNIYLKKTQNLTRMNTYPLNDISITAERYRVYVLNCTPSELTDKITFVKSKNINVINIGKELANYINTLEDFRYLSIDVFDYTKKLLDNHKSKINGAGNDVVAICNLGVLLEPALELNAVQLFKEFSKSTSLIIIWENQSDISHRLEWPTQKQNFFLDFSGIHLKKLQYAI